jgi:hypothetical protein
MFPVQRKQMMVEEYDNSNTACFGVESTGTKARPLQSSLACFGEGDFLYV